MTRPFLLPLALFAANLASAQSSDCKTTLSADAQAVVADLAAIASQAQAQGFQTAVQKLATDLKAIVPSLSAPDQQAVEKFVTDLSAAVSSSSQGGTSISTSERVTLANDLSNILLSTGMTTAQINTVVADISAVMSTLQGISTAQLQSDVQKLLNDLKACRTR